MKTNLHQSLLSRLKNKHAKLASRFQRSVREGGFQKQRLRKRKEVVDRLKSLESRIQALGKSSGFKVSLNYKHWAFALAMGAVVSVAGQDQKKNFKTRFAESTKNQIQSVQSLPQTVFLSDPVRLGEAYITDAHVGDIDGDGDLDAIVINYIDSPIILTNNGSFNFSKSLLPSSDLGVVSLTSLADFDGDGDLDLFMQNGPYNSNDAQVFVNDGAGNFTSSVASFPAIEVEEYFLLTGDLDGDGDLDLVLQSEVSYSARVEVILNTNFVFTSNATLTAPYTGNLRAKPIGLMDEDGDGDLDIIYSGRDASGNDAILTFVNDGLGNFTDSGVSNILSTGLYYDVTEGTTLLDFDNDGDLDIISVLSGGYPNFDVRSFLNDAANFNFIEQATLTVPNNRYPDELLAADFNGDGRDDFLVVTETDSLLLYQENGAGSFIRLTEFKGGGAPANLDTDGDDDLFVLSNGTLSSFENQGGASFAQNADILNISTAYDSDLVDIDGDGDLDFAEISENNGRMWLNDGFGNFTIGQEFGNLGYSVAFGDLDGDGDEDMVVGLESELGFNIWSNTGGTLSYVSNFASGNDANQVEVADMDGDGDLDIVAILEYYDNVSFDDISLTTIYRNNGALNFTEQSNYGGGYQFDIGDVDGDGDLDIAVADGGIEVILNDGTGILSYGAELSVPGDAYFYGVALADLDGDGDIDIFASNAYEDGGTQSYIFFNDGTGLSGSYSGITTGPTYQSFLSDIDGDGDMDVITGGYLTKPTLWTNDGLGTFEVDSEFPVYTDEYSIISFGDLDGDGDLDVAISGYYIGTKVLFNESASLEQEINVQGNGITILAGDTTPDVADGTDFGTVEVGSSKTSTFTIQNLGQSDLTVSSITINATDGMNDVSSDFTIAGVTPPEIIAGGNDVSFTLTYSPTNAAVIAGSLLIVNDDADEFSYPFGITAIAQQSLLATDSLALVALYNATDGANWSNNTNWLTGPVDTWFGVTETGNRISQVSLNSNNLTGTIPTEIGDLTSLDVLNFEFNNLTGILPQEIGSLTNLTFINVRGNTLTGTLPIEIGNLTNLTVLDIGQNQFAGELPSEIGNLINLGSLDMDNNLFSGSLPAELTNLINLDFLIISNNNISGLPDLTSLTLIDFDVSFNRIPDEDIALNASVITLNLGQNLSVPINVTDSLALVALYNGTDGANWTDNTNWLETGQKVESWFGVTVDGDRVTQLNLNDNNLNGTLPSEIGDLVSLSQLLISRNSFSSLPSEIGQLVNLLAFECRSCQLTGSIPATFIGLTQLVSFDINGNDLSGTFPDAIWQFPNLNVLYIGGNPQLEVNLPSNIGDLGLSYLGLKDISPIGGPIPEGIFDNTNLIVLTLGNHNFTGSIPETIGNLSNLLFFEVNDNELSGDFPSSITGLTSLGELNISNNNIENIPDMSGLTALTSLDLSGNLLEFDDLEPNAGISGILYSPQNTVVPIEISIDGNEAFAAIDTVIRAQSTASISVTSGLAANNVYTWNLDDVNLASQTTEVLSIPSMGRSNVGEYELTISNTSATDLTLSASPIALGANAIISVQALDEDTETLISENVNAYLFSLSGDAGDTTDIDGNNGLFDVESAFSFPPVLLDNYFLAVESVVPITDGNGNQNPDATYIPTFYGDEFLSEEADILELNSDTTLFITMEEFPDDVDPGEGIVAGTIEEDFPEDESRIDARRRAKKRKCGLRRRRTGGRTGQDDDFELIAYGETNDNGEFEYGFLPEGTYRFFVEYPGIPLDQSAFVQFDIGEAGVTDDEFELAVFVTPEGIEIDLVLGTTAIYFTNFSIYPNPATDLLTIEYSEIKEAQIEMEILSMEGKVLMERVLKKSQNQLNVDTSLLEPGQYLIRFSGSSAKEHFVYRMIKIR